MLKLKPKGPSFGTKTVLFRNYALVEIEQFMLNIQPSVCAITAWHAKHTYTIKPSAICLWHVMLHAYVTIAHIQEHILIYASSHLCWTKRKKSACSHERVSVSPLEI